MQSRKAGPVLSRLSFIRLDAFRQTAPRAECAISTVYVSPFGFPHIASRYDREDPVETPELFDHFIGEPAEITDIALAFDRIIRERRGRRPLQNEILIILTK